jgi:hypothetical protein
VSQPPSAEPTLWELHRALQQWREDQSDSIKSLRDDLRGDLAALSARFEQTVTRRISDSSSSGCMALKRPRKGLPACASVTSSRRPAPAGG